MHEVIEGARRSKRTLVSHGQYIVSVVVVLSTLVSAHFLLVVGDGLLLL